MYSYIIDVSVISIGICLCKCIGTVRYLPIDDMADSNESVVGHGNHEDNDECCPIFENVILEARCQVMMLLSVMPVSAGVAQVLLKLIT